jgi:hypothetical protein
VGSGPARRRIGGRDELRPDLGRRAKGRVIEHRQILVDRAARYLWRQALGTFDALLPAGIGLDQTAVDRKAVTADETSLRQRRSTVSNTCRKRSLSRKRS